MVVIRQVENEMMREIETEKKAMQAALRQRLTQADALRAEHQQLQDGLNQCCTVCVEQCCIACVWLCLGVAVSYSCLPFSLLNLLG